MLISRTRRKVVTPTPMNTLDTARTRLRPWTMDDLESFHAIWGDARVIWWGAVTDLAGSANKLASCIQISDAYGPALGWYAVELHTGAIVGNVMLQPARSIRGDIEIGWHFARNHQDEGYATEAATALLEHAWSQTDADRVVATIVAANEPAKRVATKLGMHNDASLVHEGVDHDLWVIERP